MIVTTNCKSNVFCPTMKDTFGEFSHSTNIIQHVQVGETRQQKANPAAIERSNGKIGCVRCWARFWTGFATSSPNNFLQRGWNIKLLNNWGVRRFRLRRDNRDNRANPGNGSSNRQRFHGHLWLSLVTFFGFCNIWPRSHVVADRPRFSTVCSAHGSVFGLFGLLQCLHFDPAKGVPQRQRDRRQTGLPEVCCPGSDNAFGPHAARKRMVKGGSPAMVLSTSRSLLGLHMGFQTCGKRHDRMARAVLAALWKVRTNVHIDPTLLNRFDKCVQETATDSFGTSFRKSRFGFW